MRFFPMDDVQSLDQTNAIVGPTKSVDMLGKAARRGDLEYIKTHLTLVSDTAASSGVYHALYMANLAGQLKVVEHLLAIYPPSKWELFSTTHIQSGKIIQRTYPDHLMRSITDHDSPELIRIYLRKGMDPNWAPTNLGPMHHSLLRLSVSRPKILKVVLDFGANPREWPESRTASSTSRAACANNIESLSLLLDKGAIFGSSLFDAVRVGSWDAVQYLIDRGADVNETHLIKSGDGFHHLTDPMDGRDEFNGGTALHAAVILEPLALDEYRGANFEMAKLLVQNGASLWSRNHLNWLPYHYALELGFCWTKEQIEFLNPEKNQNENHNEDEDDYVDVAEDEDEKETEIEDGYPYDGRYYYGNAEYGVKYSCWMTDHEQFGRWRAKRKAAM